MTDMTNKPFIRVTLLLAFATISCAQQNGIPSISPQEVKKQLDEGATITLFDVRRPDEMTRGVITSEALNYNFSDSDFKDNVDQLDKDKTYYVYCHSGGRSSKTVQMMKEMGFTNVYNIDGGITKWQTDGMKLVKKE